MNDIINCLFSKTPIVPKLRFNSTDIIIWPAPCYKVGASELVYAYVGTALLCPILLTFFLQRNVLFKKIRHQWRTRRAGLRDVDDEAGGEGSDETDGQTVPPQPEFNVLDKARQLAAKRAKRSFLSAQLVQASSPQTVQGQIMMFVAVVASVMSLAVHTKRTFKRPVSLELCGASADAWTVVDILANIYLSIFFVLRYIGSHKKLRVIYHLHSFGDYFNIPTVLLTLALERRFTGFGFFRIYNLIWLVDIASYRSLIRSAVKVKVIRLIILVISVVAIAAGFLHLAESLGDPFLSDGFGSPIYNGQLVPFWRVILYVYGRLTLLDLSGIRLHTHTGRITIFVFQLLAVGIIGKAIPAIVAHMKVLPDYDKSFVKQSSYLHIIVSGCVTSAAMKSFLKEFYHKDRTFSEHFKVLILSDKIPDEDMEVLMERYFNKLEYKRGTMMNLKDLNRVKLTDAAATLILADRTAANCDADDAANIMRVVSVKNLKGNARVIVQVSQYHNKTYLQNIPSWSSVNGDAIICIAELRLGLLAQSCHAPGFSTMVANLFTTRSFDPEAKYKEHWMIDYSRGAALELYYRKFSKAFYGMNFSEACALCYTQCGIVLLAIQDDPEIFCSSPHVNAPPDVRINEGTLGYFLADSKEEVARVLRYCSKCHANVVHPHQIVVCECSTIESSCLVHPDQLDTSIRMRCLQSQPSMQETAQVEALIWANIRGDLKCRYPDVHGGNEAEDFVDGDPDISEDSTGMFYWRQEQSLQSITLTRAEAARQPFSNHIVICILSQQGSQNIGLANFVYPLRSTSLNLDQIDDILIVCDEKIILDDWVHLKNMPKLFFLKGTALNRADLRAASLSTCKMCVILGAPGSSEKTEDSTLLDKSVILATLNVRAMRFSDAEIREARELNINCPIWRTGHEVPLITDLMRESNAQFLDDDDEDEPGTEFYLTQPFSGGRAFAASTLDLLMITSFFNPEINRVIQSIIFGEASLELEQILAEGAGLIGGGLGRAIKKHKGHVRVIQINLEKDQYQDKQDLKYGELFLKVLADSGILLMGILRRIEGKGEKRVVIGSPPKDFLLTSSDHAVGLQRVGDSS